MSESGTGSRVESEPRRPPLDAGTLRRVRERDPAALEAFFGYFFRRVHDYLSRLLRDPADADDATQETFLKLGRHLDRLDPDRDPTGWVFRIATNAVRDHWRARRRGARGQEVDFDVAWNTAPPDPAESAHARLEREEEAARVQRAMEGLSPADREILLLRDYEGLDTAEIGAALELAPDAVRQRHSRAVRRLGRVYLELEQREGGSA